MQTNKQGWNTSSLIWDQRHGTGHGIEHLIRLNLLFHIPKGLSTKIDGPSYYFVGEEYLCLTHRSTGPNLPNLCPNEQELESP